MSFRHQRPVSETEMYVDKISDNDSRCDLYMELGSWRKAYEVAARGKDRQRLIEVGRYIDRYIYIYIYIYACIYVYVSK
jgi:hypothetical protein